MSLLNEALRKQNKRHDQTRAPSFFRKEPKTQRPKKLMAYSGIILFTGLSALVYMGGWHEFLLPDALTQSPRVATQKIVQPVSETSPPDQSSESVKEQIAEEKTVLEPKSVSAAIIEQENHENENMILQQKEFSKIDNKKTIKSLKKKTAAIKKRPGRWQKKHIKETPEPSPAPKAPNPFYDKALNYHRQNDITEAIRMYQQVVMKDPEHYDAVFNLAAAYMKSSRFEEAYPLLKKLNGHDPDNPHVLLNLAVAEIGLGRPEKAISFLNTADSQKDQPHFEIYFHLGVAFSRLDKPEEAIQWYNRAAELRPHHSGLLFNMAVAYDKLQKYPEAIRYYMAFLKQSVSASPPEKKGVEGRVRTLKVYSAGQTE
ncbi:MAG: tetratricopeptide repeat protein [Deltaproteobacteria bacterium]|nr:tetratricopeptide repeat protein [Deltaproteobacteria bacterium]